MVQITLRPMVAGDKDMVMMWRNMPFIYERGFSGQPVTQKEHDQWFAGAIFNRQPNTYIIEADGVPIGNIRFHHTRRPQESLVSIYILEKHTGKGYGVEAIKMACEKESRLDDRPIIAEFLQENNNSKKAFKKAGFVVAGPNHMRYKKR